MTYALSCFFRPPQPESFGSRLVDSPLGQLLWTWGSILILAALLFFPTQKYIWVLRVRSLEKKLGRSSSPEEQNIERRKARMIAGIVVITFAFFFARA